MPIEVAGAIGAAPRFVMRCIHDLGTGCARPRVMAVHIVEIDEDAHRRRSALAGADHAPSLRTLAHHDALVSERHLRVHAAVRRGGAHLLLEAECPREPFEGSRNIMIEDVGEDLCLGRWHGCTSGLIRHSPDSRRFSARITLLTGLDNAILLASRRIDLPHLLPWPHAGAGTARVSMSGQRSQMRQAAKGGACLDAGRSARVSVPVPSATGFNRPLLATTAISRVKRSCYRNQCNSKLVWPWMREREPRSVTIR